MTEYSDVPEVNNLYSERQLVDAAITVLDGGGNMTSFAVEQAPPQPGAVLTSAMPPIRVVMPPPTPPDTVANLRAWLVQRQSDIDAQLAALGVVNPPAKRV